jgi:hypothetical protein
MDARPTDCKEIVLNRLRQLGLEAQWTPELIRMLAGRLFRNPNMALAEINNELKYTKWHDFQLDEPTYASIVQCLRYEGMKGLEYRLGLGFLRLAN